MSETVFLNIDLDLRSTIDITKLINELSDTFTISRNDFDDNNHNASFNGNRGSSVDKTISAYKLAYDGLSVEAKQLWQQCAEKELDIGYESGSRSNGYQSKISMESISALNLLCAELKITIYPVI